MATKSITTAKLAKAFTKNLVAHKISDKAIKDLAKQVVGAKAQPTAIDICQYGICIDYQVPRRSFGELINRLEKDYSIRMIQAFPEGILDPHDYRVRVDYVVRR